MIPKHEINDPKNDDIEYCFWNVQQTSDIYGTKAFFLQEITDSPNEYTELDILQELQKWVVLKEIHREDDGDGLFRYKFIIDQSLKIYYNHKERKIEFIDLDDYGIIS